MTQQNQIEHAFEETIRSDNFQSITLDLAEVLLDSKMDDGILKDVPWFNVLVGAYKTTNNVRDRLFIRKLVSFLTQIDTISDKKRKKMIDEIDTSKNYRQKVGDKLLYIIDECQDSLKSELVGKLFKAWLNEQINYDDLLRASECVQKVYISDLMIFIDERIENWELNDYSSILMNAGLIRIDNVEATEIQMGGKIENEISYTITEIGNKIRRVLSSKPFTKITPLF